MTVHTAVSKLEVPSEIALDVRAQLACDAPRVVVFFSSSRVDHAALARAMKDAYPAAEVLGCTTAGELASNHMGSGAVVAMALPPSLVEGAQGVLIRDPGDRAAIARSFAPLEKRFGAAAAWRHTQYVGLVLVDGLSRSEEALMDCLGDFTSVPFVGGSAGDDLKFERTVVSLNGEVCTGGAVLLLLKCLGDFAVIKTQSVRVTDTRLRATKVDEARRAVLEFDGRPAAQAYAAALGVPVGELAGQMLAHPLGLMAGREPYVRSPQRVDGDAMIFYCAVREGTELRLLESGDIVQDTALALASQVAHWGGVSALINFHCILRTLELQAREQTGAYGRVFADVPMVGFSTYGEAYLGHMNQTSTMLAFR